MFNKWFFTALTCICMLMNISCESDESDSPLFHLDFREAPDGKLRIFGEIRDYGNNPWLTINDERYHLPSDGSFEFLIEQSNPLYLSFLSTEHSFRDTLPIPTTPVFKNLCLNSVPLVENDTIDVPLAETYQLTWDPIFIRDSLGVEHDYSQGFSRRLIGKISRFNCYESGYITLPEGNINDKEVCPSEAIIDNQFFGGHSVLFMEYKFNLGLVYDPQEYYGNDVRHYMFLAQNFYVVYVE